MAILFGHLGFTHLDMPEVILICLIELLMYENVYFATNIIKLSALEQKLWPFIDTKYCCGKFHIASALYVTLFQFVKLSLKFLLLGRLEIIAITSVYVRFCSNIIQNTKNSIWHQIIAQNNGFDVLKCICRGCK